MPGLIIIQIRCIIHPQRLTNPACLRKPTNAVILFCGKTSLAPIHKKFFIKRLFGTEKYRQPANHLTEGAVFCKCIEWFLKSVNSVHTIKRYNELPERIFATLFLIRRRKSILLFKAPGKLLREMIRFYRKTAKPAIPFHIKRNPQIRNCPTPESHSPHPVRRSPCLLIIYKLCIRITGRYILFCRLTHPCCIYDRYSQEQKHRCCRKHPSQKGGYFPFPLLPPETFFISAPFLLLF